MPLRSLPHCAKQYAESWSRGERPIFEALAGTDRGCRLEALQHGAGYFRIARNFKIAFDVGQGLERLAPVLDLLEPFRTSALTGRALCDTIDELRSQLAAGYGGGDRLSAATKLLWLLRRDPVIIYDSQARRALGAPNGDYAKYVELWRSGYRKHKDAIRGACAALSGAGRGNADVDRETAQEWFRQRVYDIYLWNAGARRSTS